jgi:type III restriction enzyme
MQMGFAETDLGIGNRLHLLDEELLQNLHAVQLRNGLRPSEALASGDFRSRWRRPPARPTCTCARPSS